MTCPGCEKREAPPGEVLCAECWCEAAKADPHPIRSRFADDLALIVAAYDFTQAVTALGFDEFGRSRGVGK